MTRTGHTCLDLHQSWRVYMCTGTDRTRWSNDSLRCTLLFRTADWRCDSQESSPSIIVLFQCKTYLVHFYRSLDWSENLSYKVSGWTARQSPPLHPPICLCPIIHSFAPYNQARRTDGAIKTDQIPGCTIKSLVCRGERKEWIFNIIGITQVAWEPEVGHWTYKLF